MTGTNQNPKSLAGSWTEPSCRHVAEGIVHQYGGCICTCTDLLGRGQAVLNLGQLVCLSVCLLLRPTNRLCPISTIILPRSISQTTVLCNLFFSILCRLAYPADQSCSLPYDELNTVFLTPATPTLAAL